MGLFINNGEHLDVFRNKGEIKGPNQDTFHIDYLSELIDEQKKVNQSLSGAFRELEKLLQQHENKHIKDNQDIGKRLSELRQMNLQHEKFESRVMDWLAKLDDKNMKLQELAENEGALKQEFMDQINNVRQSNDAIVSQLQKYESANEQIIIKMAEQFELQQKMMEDQFSQQDEVQKEVITRLENQEALTEKILRQIDHFRSILFERTSFLAEKIENGYKLTSAYVHKLLAGTDQPVTVLKLEKKQKENQQGLD